MPKYVLDTNLLISKRLNPESFPAVIYHSSIALFELMTASNDLREFRSYQAVWKIAKKDGSLLVPSEEDWQSACRISFALAQERKQQQGGKSPRLTSKVKQEIAMDCLLAVSAARVGVIVLTLNTADFDYIKRHCKNLKVEQYPPQ